MNFQEACAAKWRGECVKDKYGNITGPNGWWWGGNVLNHEWFEKEAGGFAPGSAPFEIVPDPSRQPRVIYKEVPAVPELCPNCTPFTGLTVCENPEPKSEPKGLTFEEAVRHEGSVNLDLPDFLKETDWPLNSVLQFLMCSQLGYKMTKSDAL